MLILEQREKAQSFADQYRLAAVSADPARYTKLMFPEWWASAKSGDEEEDPYEVLEDTAGTTLKFSDSISQEDAEAVLREFMANPTISVGGDEVSGGGWH